jgi:hypothetical protein
MVPGAIRAELQASFLNSLPEPLSGSEMGFSKGGAMDAPITCVSYFCQSIKISPEAVRVDTKVLIFIIHSSHPG